MKGRVSVRVYQGVADDVGRRLREFTKLLARFVIVRHALKVHIVPGLVVGTDQEQVMSGFGLFYTTGPSIYIAGIPLPRSEMSRAEWIDHAKHTIAHEFVHYQQFRDGKRLTERGVEAKATILKRLAEGQ
jgi:hypothetical protein